MPEFSLKKFKQNFYKKFYELEVFDTGNTNYFKVVLSGLKCKHHLSDILPTPIFYPKLVFIFFSYLKGIQYYLNGKSNWLRDKIDKARFNGSPQYLIIDSDRTINGKNNKALPKYFFDLYKKIKSDSSVYYVCENKIEGFEYFDDQYLYRNNITSLSNHPLASKIRNDLKCVFKNINQFYSLSIEEAYDIRFEFQLFYDKVIFWLKILEALKPKNIMFVRHYHSEGLIYAARSLDIRLIEYQHGLISKEDVFYNYPKSIIKYRKNALFPDEIRTFGNYWSKILEEGNVLDKTKIKLVKYFFTKPYFDDNDLKYCKELKVKYEKIFLFTTQTFLTNYFIKYIDNVLKITDERNLILIKPHPSEPKSAYQKYNNNSNVIVTMMDIDLLFTVCDFHLTIYSTTAFDALRFNIPTYFIVTENQMEYINEIYNEIGGCKIDNYNVEFWKEKVKPMVS